MRAPHISWFNIHLVLPYSSLQVTFQNQGITKVMYSALRKQNILVPLMMSSEGIKNNRKRQILTEAGELAYIMACLNIKQAHSVLSDSEVLGSCTVLQSFYLQPLALLLP